MTTILTMCAPLTPAQILKILALGRNAYRNGCKTTVLEDPATRAFYESIGDEGGQKLSGLCAAWRAAWHEAWIADKRVVPAGVPQLKCDMREACTEPVTHVENKGYTYCTQHALERRSYNHSVRKLQAYEIERLRLRVTISYTLKRLWEYERKEQDIADEAVVLRAFAESKVGKTPCDRSNPCSCGRSEGPHVTPNEKAAYAEVARARFPSDDDDVEFDDDPVVTEPSESGAFVQAWVFVRREDTRLCADPSCDEIVLDGGDGYDGYCPNHADKREAVA